MGAGGTSGAYPPGQQGVTGQPAGTGTSGANGANGSNGGGPTAGPNGVAQLANPAATLAPNQGRYPISRVAAGMNCPSLTLQNQAYSCTLAFNVPVTPSPAPSGDASPAPPTPSPSPSPASSASPTPTPTPPGNLTLQAEALPADVPAMTSPDLGALKIVPAMGVRLQSDTDFHVSDSAVATFTLPASQVAGRQFALQLYDETFARTVKGWKRTDTFVTGLTQYATSNNGSTIAFTFALPKTTVHSTDIWLLALYALTYPPSPAPSAPAAASSPQSQATP
jgi:hypothetical protein